MGVKRVRIDIDPSVSRQVALRRARGVSLRDLEEEFKFSRPVINRILATDESRQIMLDILRDDHVLDSAMYRRQLADLVPGAILRLAKLVEEGNIKGIELVLRGSGMLTPTDSKEDQKQAQTLTVILPGQSVPKDVVNG